MKFLLIALLGFASGLPLALTGSTLQAWSTQLGLSLMGIGALSLVSQAYVFKFLWAPVFDRFSFPGISGLRRSWLVVCQLAIGIGLAIMALCPLPSSFQLWVLVAASVAFFSANFDTVFDAFRIEYLSNSDYGLGNAIYVTAYRIAMLVSGGLALVAAAYYGWRWVYAVMAVLALLSALVCTRVPVVTGTPLSVVQPKSWSLKRWRSIGQNVTLDYLWLLAFILLYKFGEAFGTALSTTFLLRVGHYSLVQIGFSYKTCGLLATIGGSFIGAVLYKRCRLWPLLIGLGILQGASLAWYIPIALGQHGLSWMITAVSFEAATAGMATTAFVGFMMRLCQGELVASRFAVLSALASVGRVITGPLAAWLIDHAGWVHYYQVSMLSCLPALAILWRVRRHGVFKHQAEPLSK
jgi:PAT family beta-lactamase induction signal transducer AmpG